MRSRKISHQRNKKRFGSRYHTEPNRRKETKAFKKVRRVMAKKSRQRNRRG